MMKIIKMIVEFIANITLSISNFFSLIHITLNNKFEINISKPKYEKQIFDNSTETNQNIKKLLTNQEEIERLKEREKIIKEIINKKIININNLNSLSQSEYFIVIPKIYIKLNKETMAILFKNEGFFMNSIFSYFEGEHFINLGKAWSPIYIKNRDELKKDFQNMIIFKKFIDKKVESLLNRDNELIKRTILKNRNNSEIKNYYFFENNLKFEKYLYFDFMIISSLNLNEENLTILDADAKRDFISKILSHEIQDLELKNIIIKSGLRLFINTEYPKEVIKILLENEAMIKGKLKINNFLDQINNLDLEKVFKEVLDKDYQKVYVTNFMKVYNLVREF